MLEQSAGWLSLAQRVILVLDPTDDPTTNDPDSPELNALQQDELTRELKGKVHFVHVGAAGLDAAIDEALRLARETCVRDAWGAWTSFSSFPLVESGPWLDWPLPKGVRSEYEPADVVRLLAPALCRAHGRVSLLDGFDGTRLDLQTGRRESVSGLAGKASIWRPIAATPDGQAWLEGVDRNTFRIEGARSGAAHGGGWGAPIGFDPSGRIAWMGGRCYFHFCVVTDQDALYWTPSNHDWPCGHGKKLYGFKDNEPLFITLAADASACLSTYEHDTLLTPQIPLVWRDVGGFALAERMRGEPRALLFCRSDGDDVFPGDPLEADEDARDEYVVATLGPSPEFRYAVSLEKPTYRLANDRVVRLGGPRGGWIVCNDRHDVVHQAEGRLLGGWGPWVVIEQDGALHREDFVKGNRELLDFAVPDGLVAVPIAGSPNVVLVHVEPNRIRLRLV